MGARSHVGPMSRTPDTARKSAGADADGTPTAHNILLRFACGPRRTPPTRATCPTSTTSSACLEWSSRTISCQVSVRELSSSEELPSKGPWRVGREATVGCKLTRSHNDIPPLQYQHRTVS